MQQSSYNCFTSAFLLWQGKMFRMKYNVSSAFFGVVVCHFPCFSQFSLPVNTYEGVQCNYKYKLLQMSYMRLSHITVWTNDAKVIVITVTAESECRFQTSASSKDRTLAGGLTRSILLNTSHLTSLNVGLCLHTGCLLVLLLCQRKGVFISHGVGPYVSHTGCIWVLYKCHLSTSVASYESVFFLFHRW